MVAFFLISLTLSLPEEVMVALEVFSKMPSTSSKTSHFIFWFAALTSLPKSVHAVAFMVALLPLRRYSGLAPLLNSTSFTGLVIVR